MYPVNNASCSNNFYLSMQDTRSNEDFIKNLASRFTGSEIKLITNALDDVSVEDQLFFKQKWIEFIQSDAFIVAHRDSLDTKDIKIFFSIKQKDLTHVIDETLFFASKYHKIKHEFKPKFTRSHLIATMKMINKLPKESTRVAITHFFSWINDKIFNDPPRFDELVSIIVFFSETQCENDIKNIVQKLGKIPRSFTLNEVKNIVNTLPDFSVEDKETIVKEFLFSDFLDELSINEISFIINLFGEIPIDHAIQMRQLSIEKLGDIIKIFDHNIPTEDHLLFIRSWQNLLCSRSINGILEQEKYYNEIDFSTEIEMLETLATIKKEDVENVANEIIRLTENFYYLCPSYSEYGDLLNNLINSMANLRPEHRNNVVNTIIEKTKYASIEDNCSHWKIAEKELELAIEFFSSCTLPWDNYSEEKIDDIIEVMRLLDPQYRSKNIIECISDIHPKYRSKNIIKFITCIDDDCRKTIKKIITTLPKDSEDKIVENVTNNMITHQLSFKTDIDIAIQTFKLINSKYHSTKKDQIKWDNCEDIKKIMEVIIKIPEPSRNDLIKNAIDNINEIHTVSDLINRLSIKSWYQICSIN